MANKDSPVEGDQTKPIGPPKEQIDLVGESSPTEAPPKSPIVGDGGIADSPAGQGESGLGEDRAGLNGKGRSSPAVSPVTKDKGGGGLPTKNRDAKATISSKGKDSSANTDKLKSKKAKPYKIPKGTHKDHPSPSSPLAHTDKPPKKSAHKKRKHDVEIEINSPNEQLDDHTPKHDRKKFRTYDTESESEESESGTASSGDSSWESDTESDSASDSAHDSDRSRKRARSRSRSRAKSVTSNKSNKSYQEYDSEESCDYSQEGYKGFELRKEGSNQQWTFLQQCRTYVEPKFRDYAEESLIKPMVTSLPRPTHSFMKNPELDLDVKETLKDTTVMPTKVSSKVLGREDNLSHVQEKVLRIMGPLGKLYQDLFKLSHQKDKVKVKVQNLCTLAEKAILLTGQAHISVRYHRQLEIVSSLMNDHKEAKNILRNYSKYLKCPAVLFGPKFQRKLDKDKKLASEKGLAAWAKKKKGKGKKGGFKKNRKRRRRSNKPDDQPFPNGPPQNPGRGGGRRGRGGGRGRGAGRGHSGASTTSGQQPAAARYVYITTQSKRPGKTGPKPERPGKTGLKLKRNCRRGSSTELHSCKRKHVVRKRKQGSKRQRATSAASKQRTVVFVPARFGTTPSRGVRSSASTTGASGLHNRGSAETRATQLAQDNRRSDHSTASSRGTDTFRKRFAGTLQRLHTKVLSERNGIGSGVRRSDARKTSNLRSRSGTNTGDKPPVSTSKEGRDKSPGVQPPPVKRMGAIRALQDGGLSTAQKHADSGRLHDQSGSEGRLFQRTHTAETQEVLTVSMARSDIRIPMSTIRPSLGTERLHQDNKTGDEPTTATRDTIDHLLGRSPDTEPGPPATTARGKFNDFPPTGTGMGHKPIQVLANSESSSGVLGVGGRHNSNDFESPNVQSGGHKIQVSVVANAEACDSALSSKTDRHINLHNDGGATSTAALPSLTDGENESLDRIQVVRGRSTSDPSMLGGTQMVVSPLRGGKRQDGHNASPGHGHRDRREPGRLGGISHQWSVISGPLDTEGVRRTNQLSGDESSSSGAPSVGDSLKSHSIPRTHQGGQHLYGGLPQQKRRDQVQNIGGLDQTSLGMVHDQANPSVRRIPARHPESDSGRVIQASSRSQRLATERGSVSEHQSNLGPVQCGLVRQQNEQPNPSIRQLENRPRGDSDRRFSVPLAAGVQLRFPSILFGGQMSGSDSKTEGHNGDNYTSMVQPGLVRQVVRDVDSIPDLTTSVKRLVDLPVRTHTSTVGKPVVATSSVEGVGGCVQTEGLSDRARDLVSKSLRQGTRAVYESAWKRWTGWCTERNANPLHAPVGSVVEYLSDLCHEGLSYRTINCHRSAISSYHVQVDGHPVGQHALVQKVMTGVFNENPPQPRYGGTWDVDVVLNHIRSLGKNDALSDAALTKKTVILTALATGARASEIHAFNLEFCEDKGHVINFQIPTLTKSRRRTKQGGKCLTVSVEAFPDETCIDPAACIRAYIRRTCSWRVSGVHHPLFLSTVNPHKPVVKSTISGWILKLMAESDIDIGQFKAHSTRGAATTKAASMGLSIQDIVEKANWSNTGTFKRFYYRPDDVQGFAQAVLKVR